MSLDHWGASSIVFSAPGRVGALEESEGSEESEVKINSGASAGRLARSWEAALSCSRDGDFPLDEECVEGGSGGVDTFSVVGSVPGISV